MDTPQAANVEPQPEQGGERPAVPEVQPGQVQPAPAAGEPAPAAGIPPVTPAPAPASPPPQPAADSNPQLADDVDVIEKEWVDRAEKIIAETKDDPYREEEAVEDLQIDYLKKRYGKDIKKTQE